MADYPLIACAVSRLPSKTDEASIIDVIRFESFSDDDGIAAGYRKRP
jgi:hypothetical protein